MYRTIAVLSVVLLVGLAGCGGPGPGAETPEDGGVGETPGAGDDPAEDEGAGTPTDEEGAETPDPADEDDNESANIGLL